MSAPVKVTHADFQERVLKSPVPVLVDFWAEWCGPCKALAPVLDTIAADYGTALAVVKLNVDEEQDVAAAFGIRSLPTMMVFVGGQPVEQIVGAQPEANIRAVLERFIDTDAPHCAEAESPLPGDADGVARLRRLLEENPDNTRAKLALARIEIVNGQLDEAQRLLESLDAAARDSADAMQVAAALEFARLSLKTPTAEDLQGITTRDPANLAARCQLGVRLVEQGDYDLAAEQFLYVLKRNREFDGGSGRELLLRLFDLLGPDDPRVALLRRKMMSALY